MSPAVEPSEGCGQDMGCDPGWGVLKKWGQAWKGSELLAERRPLL